MTLDIRTAVLTLTAILIVVVIIMLWQGISSLRKARSLPFFRMRRVTVMRGWRLLIWSIILAIMALLVNRQLEPFVYRFFPPTTTPTLTPTITPTPTISLSPSISPTPSITLTPLESYTPTVSPTPHVPLAIEVRFESTITPNPDAKFSQLTFTDGLDSLYRPLKPGKVFQNPIKHMYAVFSYDGMVVGSQWSALWYRGTELVNFETIPWNGATGGLGYTDWGPSPDQWLPGIYEVQIYVGLTFKVSGFFTIEGVPPTPLPSPTFTPTPTPTRTRTPTRTPRPTATPWPTITPRPTRTPFFSPTPTLSITPWPTQTRTLTPSITPTRTPTSTPIAV